MNSNDDSIVPEGLAEEDAVWNELFERSLAYLAKLVKQANKSIENGTATDFDPDVDEV